MAIPSGSGTEVLKSIMWEDVGSSTDAIFTGAQHHIYTVLSIIVTNMHTSEVTAIGNIYGYDSYEPSSNEYFRIFKTVIPVDGTFVFNDKFVVHGQGSNNAAQKIQFGCGAPCDITMSYIDQDWS